MNKIAIMCDSSADISKEEAKKLDIHVIRMPLMVDGKEYIEEESIGVNEIITALKREATVKTSQPVLGAIKQMWDELLETYDEVFYLPLSSQLSGTCATSMTLAEEYDGRVTVVNSKYACYPIVVQLLEARKMFEKGYDTKEVKRKIEEESDLYAVVIPENLTTLKNGGRISPAAAAVAGLLKIQPLLSVDHGAIDLIGKIRTLKRAYNEGIRAVMDGVDPQDYYWMVIDADNKQASDELKDALEKATGQPVMQRDFRSILLCHMGPGAIAFGRIRKMNY